MLPTAVTGLAEGEPMGRMDEATCQGCGYKLTLFGVDGQPGLLGTVTTSRVCRRSKSIVDVDRPAASDWPEPVNLPEEPCPECGKWGHPVWRVSAGRKTGGVRSGKCPKCGDLMTIQMVGIWD